MGGAAPSPEAITPYDRAPHNAVRPSCYTELATVSYPLPSAATRQVYADPGSATELTSVLRDRSASRAETGATLANIRKTIVAKTPLPLPMDLLLFEASATN